MPPTTPVRGKYHELMRRLTEVEECLNGTNKERLDWLVRRQAHQESMERIGNAGHPWYPPSIYPDKIAEILGIEVHRVNEVCNRAGLGLQTNDARCEMQVRALRDKWDSGEACDVVDLTEASVALRCSTPKARQLLAENAIHPTNTGRKPYLYPRADVLALAGRVVTREARLGFVVTVRELKNQREAEIARIRADYDQQDRELHAEVVDLQARIRTASDRRAALRHEREARVSQTRLDYEARIREAGG